MNKTAIKNFAVEARVMLINAVTQLAYEFEVTENGTNDPAQESVNGRSLTAAEKNQRSQLIANIRQNGFTQTMEEAAYTWFNRFIALRFMEVNNYLPSHTRIFSDESGNFKPEVLSDAANVEIDGLDKELVLELLENQENERLYKYIIITQCNALNKGLPEMFEQIGGWTELLFPRNLLREDSVIAKMITEIPEEDWRDQVQIIGWLYQYYNTELKDDTFAQLKKNVKITKERIPAATQLFTPDWIVRYMVENSLGRLWLEGHPNAELHDGWKYYLDEAEQEPEVEAQLAKLREEYKTIKPEEIKVIDPCMGSGHILVYAFDVLMQIYTSAGWDQREAAQSILKNNLFGLDIDDRAAQLAYFAVMMKARQYDRRLLTRGIQPNIYSIRESNGIQAMTIEYFHKNDPKLKADIESIVTEMRDAKEYGSILNITPVDCTGLYARFDEIREDINMMQMSALDELLPLVKCAELLAQKYDVVVTNPPYMGVSIAKDKLNKYVKENYNDAKEDLYLVFIKKCNTLCNFHGFQAMITQHSWMFLSRSEKLRIKMLNNLMVTMAHLGARAFEEIGGEVVQTTSFVLQKDHVKKYIGRYKRLVSPTTQDGKEQLFFSGGSYDFMQDNFKKIPGNPIAYWISDNFIKNFSQASFDDVVNSRVGLDTGNNDEFLRLWFEVDIQRIEFAAKDVEYLHSMRNKRFVPHTKGGEYRKWYGNYEYIIKFSPSDYSLLMESGNHLPSRQFYFCEGMNWTRVSSKFAVRLSPSGSVFNSACPTVFVRDELENYTLALLNSTVAKVYLDLLSPTINFQAGDVGKIPYIRNGAKYEDTERLTRSAIESSKEDWDSYETSWDFKRNPLV